MTDKHFNAILAKNSIAKELAEINTLDMDPEIQADTRSSIWYIINQLKEIEKYIGEGNQPCIDDIIKESL